MSRFLKCKALCINSLMWFTLVWQWSKKNNKTKKTILAGDVKVIGNVMNEWAIKELSRMEWTLCMLWCCGSENPLLPHLAVQLAALAGQWGLAGTVLPLITRRNHAHHSIVFTALNPERPREEVVTLMRKYLTWHRLTGSAVSLNSD